MFVLHGSMLCCPSILTCAPSVCWLQFYTKDEGPVCWLQFSRRTRAPRVPYWQSACIYTRRNGCALLFRQSLPPMVVGALVSLNAFPYMHQRLEGMFFIIIFANQTIPLLQSAWQIRLCHRRVARLLVGERWCMSLDSCRGRIAPQIRDGVPGRGSCLGLYPDSW